MEQFSAAVFVFISRALADLRVRLDKIPPSQKVSSQGGEGAGICEFLGGIKVNSFNLGLKTSFRCAEEIQQAMERGETAGALIVSLVELDNTIRREMTTHWFFHLEESQAQFYNQNELFGAEVNVKFPSISYDMVEAGNCCAMGRSTAAVFHLMRIMEVGVQELGTALGVSMTSEKNWQNILDEVNKALKGMPPKDPRTVELCGVSANLYAVKLAWRNEVMHPKDTYTLEDAENLIRQVKIFMGQLAKVV